MNKKFFYLSISAFGFSLAGMLQVTYLSTLLQFAGFKSHLISYLWLVPPITGLICQPLIGLLSDNVHTKFGRRRPFFIFSTLSGVLGLLLLPFTHHFLLLLMLIILLDIGTNGNSQILRAFILDVTKGQDRIKALSWTSALGSLGAVFGCLLPWILIHLLSFSTVPVKQGLPFYIQLIFMLGAGIYFACAFITLITIKEPVIFKQNLKITFLLKDLFRALTKLPKKFLELSYVLFFVWIAFFSVWNYLNIAVAQTILHMPVEWTDNLERSGAYLSRANVWTAGYFGIVQLSSTLFAFFIPWLNKRLSTSKILTIGLMSGGLSLILISLSIDKYHIVFFTIFYGIAWAILQTCPYDIFATLIPKKNNGYYLGIFNIAVVLPQILTGLTLGLIYQYIFLNKAFMVILMSGICLLIGLFLNLTQNLKNNKIND